MKKIGLFFCMLCLHSAALLNGQAVKPLVFALDLKNIQKNKQSINAGDAQLMPAYKKLLKDADEALAFGPVSVMEKKHVPPSGNKHDYMSLAPYHWPDPSKPDGLPYLRKDGQTNPEVREYKDKEYMPKLCDIVQILGLAWYFSGEKKYAAHAATLLRVWFLDTATRMNPNLDFAQAIKGVNTGRGAGLIDSRHFIKLIDGIGLISSSSYWKEKDQQGMQDWFAEFLNWMQKSKNGRDEMDAGNNHGVWYDAQRLSMALFTGDKLTARQVVESAMQRLDQQMDEGGSFPEEMKRTISLHYTVFVMNAFFVIAQMADDAGMELWSYTSPSGKSLKKAFTVLHPYLVGEKKWEGTQIKDFEQEDGYPLLMEASVRFKCKSCREQLQSIAGEKAGRLRILLLY
jgi:hypothetical protein